MFDLIMIDEFLKKEIILSLDISYVKNISSRKNIYNHFLIHDSIKNVYSFKVNEYDLNKCKYNIIGSINKK